MQGTLVSRYIRCGKPNCRCAGDPEKCHGPYWYLVWRKGRRLRMRYVQPRALDEVRAAIDARRSLDNAIRDCRRDIELWKNGKLEEWIAGQLAEIAETPNLPSIHSSNLPFQRRLPS